MVQYYKTKTPIRSPHSHDSANSTHSPGLVLLAARLRDPFRQPLPRLQRLLLLRRALGLSGPDALLQVRAVLLEAAHVLLATSRHGT